MTRDYVEKEMTRRFKEANLEGMTIEQARKVATRLVNEMACEKAFSEFFAHLNQPQAYSVGCSVASPEDMKEGKLSVDIELKDPLLINAYLKNAGK